MTGTRSRGGAPAAATAAAGLLLWAGACGPREPAGQARAEPGASAQPPASVAAPGPAAQDSPGSSPGMVQWLFEPDAGERARLDSLLAGVERSPRGPDFRFGGELYRFGAGGARGRYLLVAARDTTGPPERLGDREFLLYVLGPAAGVRGWGEPHRVQGSPESSHPFAVGEVRDFDGDAAPDVAYCTGGTEEDGGTPAVAGYRDGRWYAIPAPDSAALCR